MNGRGQLRGDFHGEAKPLLLQLRHFAAGDELAQSVIKESRKACAVRIVAANPGKVDLGAEGRGEDLEHAGAAFDRVQR